MHRGSKIALVVPAHNEESLILPTIASAPAIIDAIYLVDDGSHDATVERALTIADPRLKVMEHGRNLGVGAAIITGYQTAFGEGAAIAVVVGGDNQMDLSEVENFLDPIIDDATDYAKGNRFLVPGSVLDEMPKIRLLGNAIISAMTKIASGYFKIYDVVDGYTAISRRAFESVRWSVAWKGYGYPMDFLIRLNVAGMRVMDVPRRAIYLPGVRQSQIKGFRYATRVAPLLLRGFLRRLLYKYILRDFHPLVFFYLLGMTLTPLGALYGFFLVGQQLTGYGVSGPRAILCTLLLLVGIQSFLFAMSFELQNEESSRARAAPRKS